MDETKAIVPHRDAELAGAIHQDGLVVPLASPDQAREMTRAFGDLKQALVLETDCIWIVQSERYQNIYGSREEAERKARTGDVLRAALKKSGVLKLALAFGITTELVAESWASDGSWVDIAARARHRSGASAEDTASAERDERKGKSGKGRPLSRHTMRATAYTRARSRAILALIGGGEISAEELTAGGEVEAEHYTANGFGQPATPHLPRAQDVPDDAKPPREWVDSLLTLAAKKDVPSSALTAAAGSEDLTKWTAGTCRHLKAAILAGELTPKPTPPAEPGPEPPAEPELEPGMIAAAETVLFFAHEHGLAPSAMEAAAGRPPEQWDAATCDDLTRRIEAGELATKPAEGSSDDG